MEIVESGLTICMENSYHQGVGTTIRRKAIGRRGEKEKNAEKENEQQFAVGIGSSRFGKRGSTDLSTSTTTTTATNRSFRTTHRGSRNPKPTRAMLDLDVAAYCSIETTRMAEAAARLPLEQYATTDDCQADANSTALIHAAGLAAVQPLLR